MKDKIAPAGPEGLSSAEAARRRAVHGPNRLEAAAPVRPLAVLLRQFTSFLVLLLIAAAGIALVLGEIVDAVAIGLVVLLNGVLGFVQEWRAETAIEALRSLLAPQARVIRDGAEQMIEASEIVPGDRVIIEAGDRVPADVELGTALTLAADESILTGESLPVRKSAEAPENRLWMGTTVVEGRGEGVVAATGAGTEFGQIAKLTASVGEKKTRLQAELGRLARTLGLAALAIGGLVVGLGTALGRDLVEMLLTGLSLAVAMVPEGLPAVVTITLALGASDMARRKALARRLQAVETLGAASVICTDKTGTLTENSMTVTVVWTPDRYYRVTGTGYDPAGHIADGERRVRHGEDPCLSRLLEAGLVCNHARLAASPEGWQMVGSPTEGALATLAYKGWTPLPDPEAMLSETPFSSDRKRMSVLAREENGLWLHAKGAPEAILEVTDRICRGGLEVPLTGADREEIAAAYRGFAETGLRVIALAGRAARSEGDTGEEELTFYGLAGLIDPPRPEVRRAIGLTRSAGIRVVMITGDSPVTASAIAGQIGLPTAEVRTGAAVEEMDDGELEAALARDVIFARARPAHKMRIVRTLQRMGEVVAMTGDGVNDTPALKQADIGMAMGQRGTDVAKDASDLVLLDDNFATIVAAISEGRRQWDNLRKFVRYLLASNTGEVIAIVVNLALGGPLIFLATQILWMNLVTDGVTAVSLGLEKEEPGLLDRPPRAPNAPVLGLRGMLVILCFGLYTSGAALWLFSQYQADGVDLARTVAFTGMVVFEKASVFAFRTLWAPLSRVGWLTNRWLILALVTMLGLQALAVYWGPLQLLLRTVPMSLEQWGVILLLALPLVIVPEVAKRIWLDRKG